MRHLLSVWHFVVDRPALKFFASQVWWRTPQIILSPNFLIALLLACYMPHWGHAYLAADLPAGEIVVIVITYAAIAVGFCVAGMALSIANPSDEFAKEMATPVKNSATIMRWKSNVDRFSNLVFVFSWTAAAHIVLILFCLGAYLAVGSKTNITRALDPGDPGKALLQIGFFLTLYCILQFFVTVLTLTRFGELYIKAVQRQHNLVPGDND